MAEIVPPFLVEYEGRDADRQELEATALGESLVGGSRLYSSVAHYCAFGYIPKPRTHRELACYARPAEGGSWRQWFFIAPIVVGEYAIHSELYKEAASFLFKKFVDTLKQVWTKPSELAPVIQLLTQTLQEQAARDAAVQELLANGIVHANDNLASLQSQLINTLPILADANRTNARMLVKPIGNTCDSIAQFPRTPFESRITEAEAEAIRGEGAEVDPMAEYPVSQISEINLKTGHCVVELLGGGTVPGKITDPELKHPNNVYTRALNAHTGCTVEAKALRQNGVIKRLYISDAHD